uniref:Ig-like domain-containing protein n=1 Tax=Acanthochromis polyacanthus TaxID=80966 RepID=A0A3Q1GFQ7_9TELE
MYLLFTFTYDYSLVASVNLNTVFVSTEKPQVIGSLVPIQAAVGEDVILPCHLKPESDVRKLTVEWKHNKTTVHMYRSLADDPDSQDERFKNRTRLFRDEMVRGNISLNLSYVTEQDKGIYTCSVHNHTQVIEGNVTLEVGESVGEDVILPCHLKPESDVRKLTVEWKHNKTTVHMYRSLADDPDSQDERFKNRTRLFRDEMVRGNISLNLSYVTEQDKGIYTCSVHNHTQVIEGNVTLEVGECMVLWIFNVGMDRGNFESLNITSSFTGNLCAVC